MKFKNKTIESIYNNLEAVVVAFILAMIIRQFIIAAYKIPTGSMENTLLVGDFLLGTKFIWGAKVPFVNYKLPAFSHVKRGDIVIFKSPFPPYLEFVKRAVAVSGDTVYYHEKKLYINGKFVPLPPEGKNVDPFYRPIRDEFGPFVVPKIGDVIKYDSLNPRSFEFFKNLYWQHYPDHNLYVKRTFVIDGKETDSYIYKSVNLPPLEINSINFDTLQWYFIEDILKYLREDKGDSSIYIKQVLYDNGVKVDSLVVKYRCYFMMGDNRDLSQDSRFWGVLADNMVLAKPLIIYFSFDGESVNKSFFERIRWGRIGRFIN